MKTHYPHTKIQPSVIFSFGKMYQWTSYNINMSFIVLDETEKTNPPFDGITDDQAVGVFISCQCSNDKKLESMFWLAYHYIGKVLGVANFQFHHQLWNAIW